MKPLAESFKACKQVNKIKLTFIECSLVYLFCFFTFPHHKILLPVRSKNHSFSREQKSAVTVFCSKSKENTFFLKRKLAF